MTKSKDEKKVKQQNGVSKAFTSHVCDILSDFVNSDARVYTFDANLSNEERAIVHKRSRAFGLGSKSKGLGTNRCVSVFKKEGYENILVSRRRNKKKKSVQTLNFSKESKGILMDLFRQYPPHEDEAVKQSIHKVVNKSRYNRDDFCRKPNMDRNIIANKIKSLSDRVKKNQSLKQIFEKKSKLPIASFHNDIVSTIAKHQVVLISGETGCGKTTQVPQFLLDYMWANGESCKIICTQPRRLSAMSVAERVAEERGESIGDTVGYKIRLESKGGKQTSVFFCTNGIMLRVLVSAGVNGSQSSGNSLSDLTHIIVDEIHERDQHSDFILAILRELLPSYPNLRLVLMSATLDAERFSQYFGGCPIIQVPGFTYPVKSFYLDDILPMLDNVDKNNLVKATKSICPDEDVFNLKGDHRATLDDAIEMACSNEDFDTLLELIYADGSKTVVNYQHSSTGVSALMIVAGKGRVSDVCNLLSLGAECHLQDTNGTTALDWALREDQSETAEIIKEHMDSKSDASIKENLLTKYMSTINPEFVDINLIVKLLKKICSESTDGAILVFLPGWDDINKTRERLKENPYFKDPSKFRVVPLHSMVPSQEQKKVFKRPPPGCRKIVLSTNVAETSVTIDDVVYVVDSGRMKEKSYDPFNKVSTLQASWISQASAKQREGRAGRCQPGVCYHLYSKMRAVSFQPFQVPEIKRMPIEEVCLQVKMLNPYCKIEDFLKKTLDPPLPETIQNAIDLLRDIGALSPDEELTELGEKLGSLPVHPVTSKMLLFAIMLNCLDPALTLACAGDNKEPFTLPMTPADVGKADAAKCDLASLYGGYSDQLAVIAAFDCWREAKKKGVEHQFSSKFFISQKGMLMLEGTRKLLLAELTRGGFVSSDNDVSLYSMNSRDAGILRAVVAAGLYPMVGKLTKPSDKGKRCQLETAGSNKVRLHPQSVVSKTSIKEGVEKPLVVFDEVTRLHGGLMTRNCTVTSTLPLLLLATDIVVAPGDDDHHHSNAAACGDDDMDVDKSNEPGGEIMSSPDNLVTLIVDNWLLYEATALQVAQIYCLRERLSSAILFKVANPNKVLPPELGASVYAIACLLSYDGLSGISSSIESPNNHAPSSSLTLLIEPMPMRDESSYESEKLRASLELQVERVEAEAQCMEEEAQRVEEEARCMEAEAKGRPQARYAVGTPGMSSKAPKKQPWAPVKYNPRLMKHKKQVNRSGNQLNQAGVGSMVVPPPVQSGLAVLGNNLYGPYGPRAH